MLLTESVDISQDEQNNCNYRIRGFPAFNVQSSTRVVEKFTKLSKIAVKHSMECFTADFLRFFTEKPQKLVLLWRLCTGDQKSKHFGDFLEIPLLPTIQSYLVTRELTRTFTFWT